jgi:CBS domain containing-hemolysin-like protein
MGTLIGVGLLITVFAATASKALQEFSRRELEVYCRRRRRGDRFEQVLEHYEQAELGLESLQIVGTAVLMLATALAATNVLDDTTTEFQWHQFVGVLSVSCLMLLLVTAWIPQAIVALWTGPFIYHSWPLLKTITQLLWPLTLGVKIVGALLRRLAGRPEEEEDEEEAFEDEIRSIVTEGLYDGVLEEEEREMIEGVIELGDTDVTDIMTPRSNIDALDVNLPWNEVLAFVVEAGRTRVPVYEESLDQILGILYVKDLLTELSISKNGDHKSLRDLVREAEFVPPTKPLDEMLQDFLRTRKHLAIVVDEYRSVAGVVTIEDVLEEIVGEIVDESDQDLEDEVQRIDERTAEVLGTLHVDVLNEELGLELSEPDEYDTVAGLVVSAMGRIPKPKESITVDGVKFTVLDSSRRRVSRIRVEITDAPLPS